MNFPTVPRGGLLYVAMSFSIPERSFDVPSVLLKFHRFNLVFQLSELRSLAPVSFGTAKVGNFFKPANFFLFFLKLFFVSVVRLLFPYFKSLICPSPSPFVVTSVAGCKGRKIFCFPKLFLKFF